MIRGQQNDQVLFAAPCGHPVACDAHRGHFQNQMHSFETWLQEQQYPVNFWHRPDGFDKFDYFICPTCSSLSVPLVSSPNIRMLNFRSTSRRNRGHNFLRAISVYWMKWIIN